MLRFLVVIDRTVEASFALRSACRLAKEKDAYLEALHVADPASRTLGYGAGWAVHTYTRERLQELHRDMAGVLASEGEACGSRPELKIVFGHPVKALLREAVTGGFDFLFLGGVHPAGKAREDVSPRILRKTPCPVVVYRQYRPLRKALLCVGEAECTRRAAGRAQVLLGGMNVPIHLLSVPEAAGKGKEASEVDPVRRDLEAAGLETGILSVRGEPMAEIVSLALDYDLLILGVPRPRRPDPFVRSLLRAAPTPLLLCP